MKRLTISFFLFLFFVLIILAAQSLFAQSSVSPSDNATGVSQGLTIIFWTDFDNGNGNGPYDAGLDDDPTFSSPDYSISNTSNTSWDVSGFTFNYNITYYWRVRDTDTDGSGGDGPWHNYSFTIELATPSLTSPSGSFLYTTPVNFTWTMSGNYSNVDFTVTVASDPGFSQDVQTSTVSGVLNTSIAIPKAGQYYWKVVAVVRSGYPNSGESTTSSVGTFTMTLPGPTLISPVNGLTGVSVLPTLSWGSVTGAVSYKLYVDTSSSFSSPIYSNNEGTNTNKTFNATIPNFPLTNGDTYYWKVSAIDNNGTEYFSSIYHFTVTQGFTVDQHTPSTGQYIQSTSVILGWSLGRSAVGYTFVVQYMDATSDPTTETDWSSATSVNVAGSSNSSYSTTISVTLGKIYYWRVLIKRTLTNEYVHYPSPTTYNYFYTEGGLTVTLTPNWPKDNVYVYTNTPRLDWIVNGYTGGLTYQVQYRRTTGPGAPTSWTQTADNLTNLYYTIPSDLWPGQTYEWQVRAKYGSNYTSWSASAYFICYGPGTLEVPTPNYPAGGVTVYTNTPRLDWVLTTSGTGLKYQVRYSTSNSLDDGQLNGADATNYPSSDTALPSDKYLTLPSLTPGRTYYWQVRSYSSIVDNLNDSLINGSPVAFSSWSLPTSFVNNGPGTLVVPTPNWPIGGIMVYTTSPQLSWYLNPYSTGLTYDIDYSDGGNPDGTPDVTGVSNQYYQLTGLTPGDTIKWRVRSKNSFGQTSAWSSTETFVIAGGNLSYAVANWPKDGITVYTNRPELSWYLEGSTLGITGYEVKYKKTSAPSDWLTYNPSTNDSNGGKYTVSGVFNMKKTIDVDLTYGATYYWAVYPIGASSFNPAGKQYFVVVGGPGSTTISLNWPYDGITVYSTTVTFSWIVIGSEAGITEYELVYSQSDVFAPSVTTTVTGITQKSYTDSGLTAGATYYWKVKAKYADGSYTNYSSVYSFTIQEGSALIVQPFVGSPHNVVVPTTSATFSWILPVPPAPGLKYELEYSTSPNFANANKVENIPTQFVTVSGLQPNTRYYWRVRSKANDGTYSYFSNTGKFGVELTTGIENQTNIPSNYDLKQNYPNPFNPNTKIVFDLPENAKVTLHIYSLLGELVATIVENEELPAGRYERMFDASKLTSGVYFYQIITEKFTSTKKMVLIK